MTIASATELKQKTAALLDRSQREPVLIRRHARDAAVITSIEEYEDYRRMKAERLLQLMDRAAAEAKANGITEEIANELLGIHPEDSY